MFGIKNNNKQDADQERKTGVFFGGQEVKNNSEYDFPVHTMADDLVARLNETEISENKKTESSGNGDAYLKEEKESQMISKEKEVATTYQSSPFASAPVVAAPQSKQNNSLSDTKQKKENIFRENFSVPEKNKAEGMVSPFKMEDIPAKKDFDFEKREKVEIPIPVDLNEEIVHPIEKHLNWKKVSVIIAFVVVILAVAGGVYYFFITRSISEVQLPDKDFSSESSASPNTDSNDDFIFSSQNPNYLNLDMEIADKNSIFQLLEKTFSSIAPEQDGDSIEFVISDMNNNPIAFSRFAYVFDLSLPQAVLDETDEAFSIFLQKTGNVQRIGLAVSIKDSNVTPFVLKENESGLITGLKPLFLGRESGNMEKIAFKDSSYENGFKVRYVNINFAIGDSIDYGIWKNQLLIGTSKDSLRSIFDKIDAEGENNQIINMDSAGDGNVAEEINSVIEGN